MKKLLLLFSVILLASCSKEPMDAPAPRPQVVTPPPAPSGLTQAQATQQGFQLVNSYKGRVSNLEYATFSTPNEASRNAELFISINGYNANISGSGEVRCMDGTVEGDIAGGWYGLTGFINVPNSLELESFREDPAFAMTETVTVTTDTGTETQEITTYLDPTLENVLAAYPALSAGDFEVDNPDTEDWNDIHVSGSFTASNEAFVWGITLEAVPEADPTMNKEEFAFIAYGNQDSTGYTPHGEAVWNNGSVSIDYSGTMYSTDGSTAIGIVQASGSCPSSSKGIERPSTYTIKIAGDTYEISELIEYDRTTESDTNIYYHFNHVNDGNIQYQINYNKETKLYYTYITIDKWNNGVIGVSRNLQAAINVMAGR